MNKLALLVALFLVGATSDADAVPQTVSFTGRLSTEAGPVKDSVNLTFKLYDVATGGTAVWTEVRNGVGATTTGLVFVDLGQVTTLDSSLFTGTRMYLEIVVGSETLAPRVAINSVPYALHTADSDTLGGSITAADVVTSAAGTNGITATKTGNALSVSLQTTGCTSGQVYKYNGTGFACADDNTPAAGAGIAVSGNTVSLSTTGCVAGEVWKFNGSTWSCDPDVGIAAEVDGVIGNEVTGAADTSLTRSGSGTAGSPYALALNTANANNWSATQTFSTIDVNGTTLLGWVQVSAGSSTPSNSSNCSNWNLEGCDIWTAAVTCPTGTVVIGGGCAHSRPNVDVNLVRSAPSGSAGWSCAANTFGNNLGGTLTAHAICARVGN